MTVYVSPESAGWDFSGLRVVDLPPGGSYALDTGRDEVVVLSLSGSCSVLAGSDRALVRGRDNVFSGVSDCVYVPVDTGLILSTVDGGRFALCTARASRRLPFRYLPADAVPVELRGAGPCSRQVNNFGVPGVLDADRLIACEVLTPGGNWSSYPPHKHDTDRPGESVLEEIYYFEVAGSGPGFMRVYASDARPVDVLAQVRTGDVVLVPYGWHGPAMAVPGYDMYYLNVMAGPGERAWLISDDPAHAWIRSTWADQPVDPRLPLAGKEMAR